MTSPKEPQGSGRDGPAGIGPKTECFLCRAIEKRRTTGEAKTHKDLGEEPTISKDEMRLGGTSGGVAGESSE
ncbi:hypothetical protein CSOJ01_07613 [Colletotrichum sojae]|uniref:Uncharacterized protein n=1 Tax=Colletotrichum sojae TaxID=2175907 RepID=A0A8H6J944_9PEZI|nr:hypothetical protein CSOJ01_07613 [Colletotrichum sojae]